jgi:hypothetical protein
VGAGKEAARAAAIDVAMIFEGDWFFQREAKERRSKLEHTDNYTFFGKTRE